MNMLHQESAVGISLWKFLGFPLNVLLTCLSPAASIVNCQKSVIKSSGIFAIKYVPLSVSQESATQLLLDLTLTLYREGRMIPDGMIKVLTDHAEAHRNVSRRQPELLYNLTSRDQFVNARSVQHARSVQQTVLSQVTDLSSLLLIASVKLISKEFV